MASPSLDDAPPPVIQITSDVRDWDLVADIFRLYAESLRIDLSFQGFETELAQLPGEYAGPRGALFVAIVNGELAGCCALRTIDNVDYANAGEMKRLFVKPTFRRFGLGRQLAQAVLDAATKIGLSCVLLDTLSDMEVARALYEDLGFVEIDPYYHNPIEGSHYLKVDL